MKIPKGAKWRDVLTSAAMELAKNPKKTTKFRKVADAVIEDIQVQMALQITKGKG